MSIYLTNGFSVSSGGNRFRHYMIEQESKALPSHREFADAYIYCQYLHKLMVQCYQHLKYRLYAMSAINAKIKTTNNRPFSTQIIQESFRNVRRVPYRRFA